MSSSHRRIRKTLDTVAFNNESAALAVMRAAERATCDVLRQQLLNVVHSLNQDADELRQVRENFTGEARKIA
ncbi:hypothetical protein IB229_00600 [Pseudomonas sp. PDM14]|uniref:hypothetical protein n=1 Tax=Pseudomonas sp. PDM14 TaxID=2769288 RepID=UPI00178497F1|nr:hypothetical protein [Pseudomonas sp. PDM14]MBD9481456.1 hypothetical protein [Pseudomonas sp. PDM14]